MPDIWFKFYPRDWTSDTQLNRCSLAAREVWKRINIIMREADPFGFFVGRFGEPIDVAWFANEVHASLREVKKCMDELEREGVFSRDSYGRIFSRRLVREKARIDQLRENGANGGNPALLDNHNLDNQNSKALDNQNPGITRYQIPEPDTDSLRSSALAVKEWPTDVPGLRELAVLFVAAFANCRDSSKLDKHLPHYTTVLAQIRSRGNTIEQAWRACSDAREANGKPLFAASIKTAISFLPARLPASSRSSDPYSGLRVVRGQHD